MAPSTTCSTESLIPSWIIMGVGSIMLLCLVATSVYSYKLKSSQIGWKDRTCISKMKSWAMDIWGRKSCYLPIITHLADTTTDFAAVAEFYILARDATPQQCDPEALNIWYIFGLSLSCMVVYRVISSYVIYGLTKSWLRVFTQLLDIELFRVLYVSHKYQLSRKSSPQRLIGLLEAVFEAAPQTLLQIIFLMKTDGVNTIILLSVTLSLLNLTSSVISDDKMLQGFTVDFFGDALDWCQKVRRLPWLYLFRVCDVPSHLLCLCLLWVFVHGYALTIVICIDCIVVLILYRKTNKCTDAMMGLVALPLSYGKEYSKLMFVFWGYRILWIISVNITLWIYFTRSTEQSPFIIGLWWFASLASIIKFPILWVMHKVIKNVSYSYNWFKTSKERGNIVAMIRAELWLDVIELMFYINTSPKSSDLITDAADKPYGTLLYAVCKAYAVRRGESDQILFNKMIDNHGIDLYDRTITCCDTALHGVCERQFGGPLLYDDEKRVDMAKKLLQTATMGYLKAFNHDGESLFMIISGVGMYNRVKWVIMDLIWQSVNELCEKEKNQDDEKDEAHLLTSINDAKIDYLNAVGPQGTRREGWDAMQCATHGDDERFLRKFLSLYPTADSKRDSILRTDLPKYGSRLFMCIDHDLMTCWDVLWQAIEEVCNGDDNRDEIITIYLNVLDDKGNTALLRSISCGANANWFFKVLNYYPSLLSKQEALKKKNEKGQDALQLLKGNKWKESEILSLRKRKAMKMLESALNGETEFEDIGSTAITYGQMITDGIECRDDANVTSQHMTGPSVNVEINVDENSNLIN
eukprot:48288_1